MGEGLESTLKTLSYEMDSHMSYVIKKNVVSYYETFPFWLHISIKQFLSRPSELRGIYSYRRWGMLAIIRCRIFCLPVYYPNI